MELQSLRCPECGREFDPADASTFDVHRHRRRRWIGRLAMVFSMYPLVFMVCLYGTWIVAAVSLGHWPRPSLDDPKYINWAVSAFHTMTWLAILLGSPALACNLVAILADALYGLLRDRRWSWAFLIPVGVSLITWSTALVLIRTDPGRVLDWFMD